MQKRINNGQKVSFIGPKEKVVELGQELITLGVVAGIKEIARDTYQIEFEKSEFLALEKLHVSQWNRRSVVRKGIAS